MGRVRHTGHKRGTRKTLGDLQHIKYTFGIYREVDKSICDDNICRYMMVNEQHLLEHVLQIW